jgi:tetratricopeptide (TPR) repeat protein
MDKTRYEMGCEWWRHAQSWGLLAIIWGVAFPTTPGTAAESDRVAASSVAASAQVGDSASARSQAALIRLMASRSSAEGDDEPEGQIVRELWSSRIAAPDPSEDAETRLDIKRLIRQLESVKFQDANPIPTFTPPAPNQPSPEPPLSPIVREPATPIATTSRTAEQPTAPEMSSPDTQRVLETLRRSPERVPDPLEMAELLFLSGRPTEAVPFYDRAFQLTDPEDPSAAKDRAWILFQLGNCLKQTDIARAQNAYMKLISAYPNSPWTELAKAQGRLLTWYQNERPHDLMAREVPGS